MSKTSKIAQKLADLAIKYRTLCEIIETIEQDKLELRAEIDRLILLLKAL